MIRALDGQEAHRLITVFPALLRELTWEEELEAADCIIRAALKHAVRALRIAQELHGLNHQRTAHAHSTVASLLVMARHRSLAITFASKARAIAHAVWGAGHPVVVNSFDRLFDYADATAPSALAVTLDPTLKASLAKGAQPVKCGNDACESISNTFQRCARCRTVVYCSQRCQERDWSRHKQRCRAAARVCEEVGQQKPRRRYVNRLSSLAQEDLRRAGKSDIDDLAPSETSFAAAEEALARLQVNGNQPKPS